MNSFLVRVYRADTQHGDGVIGTIESLSNGNRTTFHSFAELSNTLARQSRSSDRSAKTGDAVCGGERSMP